MKKKYLFALSTLSLLVIPSIALVSCSTNSSNTNQTIDPSFNEKNHVDTKINSQIDAKLLNWNTLTSLEIYAKYNQNSITKFVLDNISKFVSGDVSLITSTSDIQVTFVQNANESNSILLKLTILANRWYNKNEIQTTSLSNNIEIINIKQLPLTINTSGGQLANSQLEASNYKVIADLFNLNENTYLPNLNNDWFNKTLKKINEFKNISIEISNESSTKSGELVLILNGFYKQQKLDNQKILISGFKKMTSKSIRLSKISINMDNWFNDLQPIDTSANDSITSIKSEDWINKYLASATVFDENYYSLGELSNLVKDGLTISLTAQIKNKDISFTISNANYQHKQYNPTNKQWENIDSSIISLTQASPSTQTVALPTLKDAKEFLVNKTYLNLEELKNHYPSYYVGVANHSRNLGRQYWSDDNLLKNDYLDKICNKYFSSENSKLSLTINTSSITANDFKNTLAFNVGLLLNDELQLQIKTKPFELINQCKNINENVKIFNKSINVVSITEEGSMWKTIKSYLKKNFANQIDNMYNQTNNSSVKFENVNSTQIVPNILRTNLINFYNTEENVNKSWQSIIKNIKPTIFNQEINLSFAKQLSFEKTNTLNFYTQLFWLSETESFVIESLEYIFPNKITLKVENVHSGAIRVSFIGETSIGFSNNQVHNYETEFSFILIKSKWTN